MRDGDKAMDLSSHATWVLGCDWTRSDADQSHLGLKLSALSGNQGVGCCLFVLSWQSTSASASAPVASLASGNSRAAFGSASTASPACSGDLPTNQCNRAKLVTLCAAVVFVWLPMNFMSLWQNDRFQGQGSVGLFRRGAILRGFGIILDFSDLVCWVLLGETCVISQWLRHINIPRGRPRHKACFVICLCQSTSCSGIGLRG